MWWTKLTSDTFPGRINDVPRSIRARAWSCTAFAWDEFSTYPDRKSTNLDYVYRAAYCADWAARLGLVSPAALALAAKIVEWRASERFANADPMLSLKHSRYEELTFLWKALEDRDKECEAESAKREAKTARQPGLYRCAADGCGIESTSKSGLMRCSGKCPPALKPSYCSKECQKKVRFRHA